MTDNKIQSATCRGRCGRRRLESHRRGKVVAVVERQWVCGCAQPWLCPPRTRTSVPVTHLTRNAVHSAP
jgi:hypothetical protein